MPTYNDLIKYFGMPLEDSEFEAFLKGNFSGFSHFNPLESEYMIAENEGLEFGFTNKEDLHFFSHLNIWPTGAHSIDSLPFNITCQDQRVDVMKKSGMPIQTNQGYSDLLNKHFLVDSYKLGDVILSVDYNSTTQIINFIQIRDNNLVSHIQF